MKKRGNENLLFKAGLSIALLCVLPNFIYASGVVNVSDYEDDDALKLALETSTISTSAYQLTQSQSSSTLGYQTISKYIISKDENGDITCSPIYYDLTLNNVGNSSDSDNIKYYWTDEGDLTVWHSDSTSLAFTIYYDASTAYYDQSADSDDNQTYGGALNNVNNLIDSLSSDFINNRSYADEFAYGGAIYNYTDQFYTDAEDDQYGQINAITGNFVGNYAAAQLEAFGGAIYNYAQKDYSTIGTIEGDFIGNYVYCNNYDDTIYDSYFHGGAIYNRSAKIDTIIGNFIGNYVFATGTSSYGAGGAIYNHWSTIGTIEGDFIGNYIYATVEANGGAIYNSGSSIESITGDFIANFASYCDYYIDSITTIDNVANDFRASGGAIYNNDSTINSITGDFIANYTLDTVSSYGGAIYNYDSTIATIIGDFSDNYASLTALDADDSKYYAAGGAIYNYSFVQDSTITSIKGDFVGNYVTVTALDTVADSDSESSDLYSDFYAYGGAIYNYTDSEYGYVSTIGTIEGDFIGNSAEAVASGRANFYARGGAIYNYTTSDSTVISTINSIIGDFAYNWASSSASDGASMGGAIYNYCSKIGTIVGDFIGNYALGYSSYGGAIYNNNSSITSIKGDFINNSISGYESESATLLNGGAIYNHGSTIGTIEGDFINNNASGHNDVYGGAISNYTDTYADYDSTIGSIAGDFIGNYITGSSSYGGAICNYADWDTSYTSVIGDITGDFIGNYVSGSDVAGGAVYNYNSQISFLALADDVNFTGNYVINDGSISSSAIYNSSARDSIDATVNFNAFDGYSIVVNDAIDGGSFHIQNQYLEINKASLSDYSATSYSVVEFNNMVSNQTVNVYNGTLVLGSFDGITYSDFYENDDGSFTDLVVDSSIASLSNSTLTVESGAILNIATNSNSDSVNLTASTITMQSGSVLTLDAFATLSFCEESSLIIADGATILIDLGSVDALSLSDFTYELFYFTTADTATGVLSYLMNEDNEFSEYFTIDYGDNDSQNWDFSLDVIDNSVVLIATAIVPEPSTYAFVLALTAFGFAIYRRRK